MHTHHGRFCVLVVIFSLVTLAVACKPEATAVSTPTGSNALPELGTAQSPENGIKKYEVTLMRAGVPMEVRVYLPDPVPAGKIPCVFIAPAGTRLFHGMRFVHADEVEVLPYVRAGMAAASYDIDGPLVAKPSNGEVQVAVAAFENADGGIANAKAAIDYVLAKVPTADAGRFYAAGHSSAATLSLILAAHEPRIAACIAYAPCTNLLNRVKGALPVLERLSPGFTSFIAQHSPDHCASELTCPTFVFQAMDDSNVPFTEVEGYVTQLKLTNAHVTFEYVTTGNHYDSMIKQGIPAGIRWLKALP